LRHALGRSNVKCVPKVGRRPVKYENNRVFAWRVDVLGLCTKVDRGGLGDLDGTESVVGA
jgi:hypothetical protein